MDYLNIQLLTITPFRLIPTQVFATMTTYFISDLHLHEHQLQIKQLFLNFLKTKCAHADALYILGDFFVLSPCIHDKKIETWTELFELVNGQFI